MKTRKIISKRHTTNIQKRIKFSTLVTITNSSCYIYLIPQTHTHTGTVYTSIYNLVCTCEHSQIYRRQTYASTYSYRASTSYDIAGSIQIWVTNICIHKHVVTDRDREIEFEFVWKINLHVYHANNIDYFNHRAIT